MISKSIPCLPQAAMWLRDARLPKRLAVGFSGGVDSTALLLALHTLGHEVVAWHVDHGWHVDSGRDAERLSRQANVWRIEFHSAHVDAVSDSNREAVARKARYARFLRWAQTQDMHTLCLAHHLDDQVETVCMRMLQGAGVVGCMGMRPERTLEHLDILRPLLHVPKSELKEALIQADIGWLEDVSNRDTTLMRNHVRHHLFPYMRKKGVDPTDLFNRWQVQASKITVWLDAQADAIEIQQSQDEISVLWNDWKNVSPPVRACVLQRMMAILFGEGSVLGRRHIELAEAWLNKYGRGGIDLCRCRLSHQGKRLHLSVPAVSLPG